MGWDKVLPRVTGGEDAQALVDERSKTVSSKFAQPMRDSWIRRARGAFREGRIGHVRRRTGDGSWQRSPVRDVTLDSLCERDLMAWEAGASGPADAAVVTERGRFAAAHGRTEPA